MRKEQPSPPVKAETWGEERFELVDTGGVCNIDGAANDDVIEAGIRQQVDAALGDAAVAICHGRASVGTLCIVTRDTVN